MENELATVPAQPVATVEPPVDLREFTVIARYPYQMKACQDTLVAWADKQLADTKAEVKELKENLEIAVRSKWRQSGFITALGRAEKRLTFYGKVKEALAAGYCIVPDFPVDLFAVRTRKKKPNQKETRYTPDDVQSDNLPAGDGRFVSPQGEVYEREYDGEDGKKVTFSFNKYFRDVDFPFTVAKPEILKATERAMVDKVFDEIGCIPRGRPKSGDPIIVGRIKYPDFGNNRRYLSFLIAWFIDSRDLP